MEEKVVLEPKVHVISYPTFNEHPTYKIPNDGGNVLKIGAFAAKNCYASWGENGRSNEANQEAIMDSTHGSVLESINFGLFIEGISRGLSLELNRHRPLGISQRSTRYVAEEEGRMVLEPLYAEIWKKYNFSIDEFGRAVPDSQNAWLKPEVRLVQNAWASFRESIDSYREQMNLLTQINPHNLKGTELRKYARGKARGTLPSSLETHGVWTGNLREWRWVIELRSERHAEAEIRRLSAHIYNALLPYAEFYLKDFTRISTDDDLVEFVPKYHKI